MGTNKIARYENLLLEGGMVNGQCSAGHRDCILKRHRIDQTLFTIDH